MTLCSNQGIEEFARVKRRREDDKKGRDGTDYVSQPQKKIPWNFRLFSSGKLDRLRSTSRMDFLSCYIYFMALIYFIFCLLFPVPLLTGQTTARLDYLPSLAFTQFILYFNFFSTPQINTLFCDPEIEKVGFLVPIPSARRFLLIISLWLEAIAWRH